MMPRTATEDSPRSSSTPIPRTNFGWSPLCGRITTRSPSTLIPTRSGIRFWRRRGVPSYGLRDGEREPDGYVTFSWVHTFNANMLLTVSPFYHYNGADYHGGPNDYPVISTVTQTANYGGGQATEHKLLEKRSSRPECMDFAQHQYNYFNNQFTAGSQNFPPSSIGWRYGRARARIHQRQVQSDAVADLDRRLRANRVQRLHDLRKRDRPALWRRHQNSAPELGVSRLLRLILPGPAAGHRHQRAAVVWPTARTLRFAPLHGERDKEYQFGVMIPFRGWTLDADTYQTKREQLAGS